MISQIPIDKGTYKAVNQKGVKNSSYAENLINLFLDTAGGNYDRPALDLLTTLDSPVPIGMYFFDGVFIVVTSDRKIFSVTPAGVITNITGVSLPGTARPTFADDGTNVYIAGGLAPLKWAGVGNTTELLGGSPPNMTHLVYMDGYLIGNRRIDSEKNKVIQWADFESTESWNGLNFFSANAENDEVQGLSVSQRELYVVGQRTTEIWQNVGTFPVPFIRAFVWSYGTRAPYSIIAADNSVFMLDQDRRFIRFAERQFSRVSEAIEEEISTYENVDDCFSSTFTWDASIHILLIFPSAGKGWSIDLKNGQWTEWRGFNVVWERPKINCCFYSQELGLIFAGDFQSGKIWKFSSTVKTDGENIFSRVRTFCQRDGGASVRKKARLLRLNLKRDVATAYSGTLPETNPTVEFRYQDDNKAWSNYQRLSLGIKGELRSYVEAYRLGIYRSRKYEVRFTDPTQFHLTSVETDEDVMTS